MTQNMIQTETAAAEGPLTLKLPNGMWLKSFPESSATPDFLTYFKGRQARVYQVDCDLWYGSYWLKKAREVGPRVRGKKRGLSADEARPIIREVIDHLRANGLSADVSPYERAE